MASIPQTLFDIAGIRARIFTLPERPPFMLAADLAEVYGTEYRRITEAVKRNPVRFPEDFAFALERAEAEMLPQNTATSQGKRTDLQPLVFSHAGAYALSAVLKTPVAAEVSVIIHRAFAAMEQQALAEAKSMVRKLRVDVLRKKPIYAYIEMCMQRGMSLTQMWRASNYSKWRLEEAARELRAMRVIDRLPDDMQEDLFGDG